MSLFYLKKDQMLGKLLYNNPTVKIDIKGNESLEGYKKIYSKLDYPAFLKTDNIHGHLRVEPPPGKVDSHRGITLTVYGQYVTKTGEFLPVFPYFCPNAFTYILSYTKEPSSHTKIPNSRSNTGGASSGVSSADRLYAAFSSARETAGKTPPAAQYFAHIFLP